MGGGDVVAAFVAGDQAGDAIIGKGVCGLESGAAGLVEPAGHTSGEVIDVAGGIIELIGLRDESA